MKVYELSKKYNVSDKALIKVLKSLNVQKTKDLNSFSSLSIKELKVVEKHFHKDTSRKASPKEVHNEDQSELLIVRKGKDDPPPEAEIEEVAETDSKPAKVEIKSQGNTSSGKKVVRVTKKVVVKKRQPRQEAKVSVKPEKASVDNTPTANKRFSSNKGPTNNVDLKKSKSKPGTEKTNRKDPKDRIQINRGPGPDREFSKEGRKKDDWKKKGDKRNQKGSYRQREKEKLFQKKSKPKEIVSSIPKSIEIMETITVSDLAKKLNIKAGDIITKLIAMGVMATINQVIDSDTATLVASEYKCDIKIVSLYDETVIEEVIDKKEDLLHRPPIVTVMGHVDHGKTKLLDSIRETDVVGGEAGGITQHIGAYLIHAKDAPIIFLDTPGHEAFTAMRARGARVTDIVVLVVAADDGVMPQTIEAINHAKEAEVPIVVAINKVDSPKANTERVKQQLAEYDLTAEDWGGKTIMAEVSALKKTNIDKLLEGILLEAELLELSANPNRVAIGNIIESKIDIGRGPVATVLIQTGTLKIGDPFVSGIYSGKVRALFDDHGRSIEMALPSTPVEVLGLDGVPEAGDPFNVMDSEKSAKQIAQKRQELQRVNKARNVKKVTLDDLSRQIQEGEIQDLKIILKGDVQGSIEALKDAFHKLSNNEISVKVIHSSTGAVNENDVMLASASKAIIVGFHVHPNSKASLLAHREHVEIRKHSIIYDAINSIKSAMEGMLSPELQEEVMGQAEIRELFKVPKVGVIAGCYVTSGKIQKNNRVRLIRDGIEIFEGELLSLRRFKEDANEVKESFECGISIKNYQDLKVGDVIEGFLIKEIARTLE